MTLEERQQKFELFVEAMNMPLEVKRVKSVSESIIIIIGILTLLLFYPSAILFAISLTTSKFIYWGILCWTLFLSGITFLLRRKVKKNKDIEFIINHSGICTHEVGFWEWDDIQNEQIRLDKNNEYYLCYECPNGSVRVLLSDYSFYPSELDLYLTKYREFYYIKKNTFNL